MRPAQKGPCSVEGGCRAGSQGFSGLQRLPLTFLFQSSRGCSLPGSHHVTSVLGFPKEALTHRAPGVVPEMPRFAVFATVSQGTYEEET